MKKFIYQILMVLAIGAGFTACDSDDDYQPGAPTPANSMQVYFDADNTADYVCGPGEQPEIELKVSRVNDSEAAEVPIVCKSASEGLTIPSSVKFEAGQKTASLTIGVGEMEEDKKYSFDLAIDEAYADHYSSQFKGTSHFSGYALQASWKTYVKDADMTWTINGNQQKWAVDIERLGSTNRYRIKDFVGSGLDMVFLVGGVASGATSYNKILPYTNYYSYNDGTVDGYYLYDSSKGEWPSWTVGDKTVSSLCIMNSYIGYGDYSYVSFKLGYCVFATYSTAYTDGTSEGYNYIEVMWNP